MGKIALAIVCGSLAIAVAIALSNRYSFQVSSGTQIRLDHITGEVVACDSGTFTDPATCTVLPVDTPH
jgi:hypothetical protein